MKKFILRLSLAGALVFLGTLLGANAQQTNPQEPAASAPPQQQSAPSAKDEQPAPAEQQPTARPQQEQNEPAASQNQQNEAPMPASGDVQTKDAKAFTGRIMKENGKVVLKDPVTKTSYQIDDLSKVKAYMGKEVKVTGRLDMTTNKIQVETIELMQ